MHQHVGDRGAIEPELISTDGFGAEPIGKQSHLLFLDPVFHISASAVDGFVNNWRRELILRQRRDDKSRVAALFQMLRFGDHAPAAAPGVFQGSVAKILKYPDRFSALDEIGFSG